MIESNEKNGSFIDRILESLKDNSDFEFLCLDQNPVLSLPGLEIDTVRRKVYCAGEEVVLTAKEYGLLCLLASNKGQILTYEQIYRHIWKEEAFGNANNAIACHIHNLREKIGKLLPDSWFCIRCVRETGYCLEAGSEEKKLT